MFYWPGLCVSPFNKHFIASRSEHQALFINGFYERRRVRFLLRLESRVVLRIVEHIYYNFLQFFSYPEKNRYISSVLFASSRYNQPDLDIYGLWRHTWVIHVYYVVSCCPRSASFWLLILISSWTVKRVKKSWHKYLWRTEKVSRRYLVEESGKNVKESKL